MPPTDTSATTGPGPGPGPVPPPDTDGEDTLDLELPDELVTLIASSPESGDAGDTSPGDLLAGMSDLLGHVADWGPVSTPAGVFHLVPVRIERDLPLLTRWMNDPVVAEFWELANAGKWRRVDKGKAIVREDSRGQSFFFLAKGQAKVTKQGRLLNMINEGECFGEMAFIRGGEEPRHATVEAMSDLVLAEFEPDTLDKMSLAAQLHLTRALVRNTVERLALANTRIGR